MKATRQGSTEFRLEAGKMALEDVARSVAVTLALMRGTASYKLGGNGFTVSTGSPFDQTEPTVPVFTGYFQGNGTYLLHGNNWMLTAEVLGHYKK